MLKTKTYINTLGVPIVVKKWSHTTNDWVISKIKPIWNSRRFAIVPGKYNALKGLVHLPTQRVIVFGALRTLKNIATELDDQEYISFNLDYLPVSVKQNILNYVFKRVTE